MILSEEPQWSAEERTATWLHKTRGYLQQQRPPTHQPLPVCPQSTVTEVAFILYIRMRNLTIK